MMRTSVTQMSQNNAIGHWMTDDADQDIANGQAQSEQW
jgi:hypothetical protein